MAPKKQPEKRARVEEDGVVDRTGVLWRSPNFVVEMRLPREVAEFKLHFGSYKIEAEAMVARDYGALVRNSTGKEISRATVGGLKPDVHPSIFEFEESPEFFESLEGSRAQARCVEYKRLLELPTNEARIEFCKAAREDIRDAMVSFRIRYPQKFANPPLLNRLPNAEPGDGEIHRTPPPSSSEVRVPPTPGREVVASMGEGSTIFSGALSLEVQISVHGSSFQALPLMNEPFLTAERFFMILKAEIDRMQREQVDKWFEGLEPCPIDPETISPLDDHLLQSSTAILLLPGGAEIP